MYNLDVMISRTYRHCKSASLTLLRAMVESGLAGINEALRLLSVVLGRISLPPIPVLVGKCTRFAIDALLGDRPFLHQRLEVAAYPV